MTHERLHAIMFGFCFIQNHPRGFHIMTIKEMRDMGMPGIESIEKFEKEQNEFLEKYPNPK